MELAVRLDGQRLISVLEAAVQDLELLATLPEKSFPPDTEFPQTLLSALLHQFCIENDMLPLLTIQQQTHEAPEDESPETEDENVRYGDNLLFNSESQTALADTASRLFPQSLHRLLQEIKGWMQLIINTEATLNTTFDQDEHSALSLRDSLMRLREAEDDRDQVAFEMKQACEARAAALRTFTEQHTRLETQLRDTKRAADDILIPLARDREENLQAQLSTFEAQKTNAQEQLESTGRTMSRVTQTSQQAEADERKHTQHVTSELRELLTRYDTDMERLDKEIEDECAELDRIDAANEKFELYFSRIDMDRRNQLEEQRAFNLAERLRRNRDANLFRFVLKIQAVVRGFLTRRRVRLETQHKKRTGRMKVKGNKGKKKTSKSTSRSPTRKKTTKMKTPSKVRAKKP